VLVLVKTNITFKGVNHETYTYPYCSDICIVITACPSCGGVDGTKSPHSVTETMKRLEDLVKLRDLN